MRVLLSASPEAMERIQAEGKLDDWCQESVKWLQSTFGEENVVSAVLHMDEKTPHIHATVVPIVNKARTKKKKEAEVKKHYRTKAEGPRLCADDIMTKPNLKSYQTSYALAMQPFGLERGIDGSEARHISTQQYYRETMAEVGRLEELEDKEKQKLEGIHEQQEKANKELSKAKDELAKTTLKKDLSNAGSHVARTIGSLFTSKDQQTIDTLKSQLSAKDNEILRLKKAIEDDQVQIRHQKTLTTDVETRFSDFKKGVERWYPGTCSGVDFANTCATSYRMPEQAIKNLLKYPSITYTGKFQPLGEKIPFELDHATMQACYKNKARCELLINGQTVEQMRKARQEQWYLERKHEDNIQSYMQIPECEQQCSINISKGMHR